MNVAKLFFASILVICLGRSVNAFTCPGEGVFANTDTNDCKTFVYCDSDLRPRVGKCNENTYFWPEEKCCFSQYDCATKTASITSNPCEGNIPYDGIIPHPADCTKYIECNKVGVSMSYYNFYIDSVTEKQCPNGAAFGPDLECVAGYQCVNYQCTSEGVFENPNDCSTFIRCLAYRSYTGIGFYTFLFPDLNNCPNGTNFNPFLKKCDAFYNCDGINPHSVDPCDDYNVRTPFVSNPFDSDASSYLVCLQEFPGFIGSWGVMGVIVKNECPTDALFSPHLGRCYENYDPSETCLKDPCSSGPGSFVNYESGSCRSYIECRDENPSEVLYQPTYQVRYCPPGLQYSPETSSCKLHYVCPRFPVHYCYPIITTTTILPASTASPYF